MLLCANNAPAEFFSGLTRMITTNYDYETRYGENNEAIDISRPIVQEREIGTKVRIKPSINTDGTVTLRFLLEISSVNPAGGNISQVNQNGNVIQLPIDTINNEKAESIVVASHGQAVVMGGLITDSVSGHRERVPLIGDVPVVGTFFGKQRKDKDRAETVIIIIPHIIGVAKLGEPASDGVLKRLSTNPWVTHDQENMTKWNVEKERLHENKLKK